MLYKVALTFESVDEIHKFDHWDESYWAALSCGTAYYALQVCSKEGYWAELWCRWLWSTRWSSLTFESVNKILWWNHSNKSLQAVLSHGAVQMYIIHVLYKVVQTCKSVDEILKCDQTHFKRNRFIFLPSWNSAFELPIVWLLLLGYVCAFESVKSSSITTKEGTVQGACETLLF